MDKPRFNIIPPDDPRGRVRSGVIVITDDQGRKWYKIACDRCEKVVATRVPPAEGKEALCDTCRYVAQKAKPSTRVIYVKGKTRYKTRCDMCSKEEITQFIPFRDKDFLCNQCHRIKDGDPRQERRPSGGAKPDNRPAFTLNCHHCGKEIKVRFRPDPREHFFCPDCFSGQRRRKKQPAPKEQTTRVMFHIDCAYCGKKEVLDFVPSNRSGAMCAACFEKRKDQRRSRR